MNIPFHRRVDNLILAGLCTTLFFVAATTWTPGAWPLALQETAVFLLAALWLISQLIAPQPAVWHWTLIPVFMSGLVGPLQLLIGVTEYRLITVQRSLEWASCSVAFFLVLQVLTSESKARVARSVLRWFAFAFCVYSLVQYVSSGGLILWFVPSGNEAALGTFVDRDHYAAFMELLLPIVMLRIRRDRKLWVYLVTTAVIVASVVAGGSRAGSSIVAAECLIMAILVARSRRSRGKPSQSVLLWSVCICVVFVYSAGWEFLWDRLHDTDPWFIRRELNVSSIAMISARPWLGWGLGTWSYIYPAYAVINIDLFVNAAHNDWAQWACEGGLLLLLIMLVLFVWSISASTRVPWGIGIPAFFLHSIVDFPNQTQLSIWLFAILGAIAAAQVLARHNDTESVFNLDRRSRNELHRHAARVGCAEGRRL